MEKGAKRPLFSSADDNPLAARPRLTLTAIAAANPTPAVLEARRCAPGTALASPEELERIALKVSPRRLFPDAGADRGASSSPPRFKATRALFPGASPGLWLDSMERKQVRERSRWALKKIPVFFGFEFESGLFYARLLFLTTPHPPATSRAPRAMRR
jgi:hypothetical protein